jgi:hypothetical protein
MTREGKQMVMCCSTANFSSDKLFEQAWRLFQTRLQVLHARTDQTLNGVNIKRKIKNPEIVWRDHFGHSTSAVAVTGSETDRG